jgi:hypothetical protein
MLVKSHRDNMLGSTETSEFPLKLRHPTPTDVLEFWRHKPDFVNLGNVISEAAIPSPEKHPA